MNGSLKLSVILLSSILMSNADDTNFTNLTLGGACLNSSLDTPVLPSWQVSLSYFPALHYLLFPCPPTQKLAAPFIRAFPSMLKAVHPN